MEGAPQPLRGSRARGGGAHRTAICAERPRARRRYRSGCDHLRQRQRRAARSRRLSAARLRPGNRRGEGALERLGGDRVIEGKDQDGGLLADPKWLQPAPELDASICPPSAPAKTSPARRRSVSRATRRRINSKATTATACCKIRRSKSPRPPESRTITTQAWGTPPPGESDRVGESPPRHRRVGGNERVPVGSVGEGLLADRAEHLLGELATKATPGQPLTAAVENRDGAPNRRGDRRRDLLQTSLLVSQPPRAGAGPRSRAGAPHIAR